MRLILVVSWSACLLCCTGGAFESEDATDGGAPFDGSNGAGSGGRGVGGGSGGQGAVSTSAGGSGGRAGVGGMSGGTVGLDGGPTQVPLEGSNSLPCMTALDCPASSSVCLRVTCELEHCGLSPLPAGPMAAQVPGDCLRVDCTADGSEEVVIDDSDFDDDNPCTTDSCSAGIASHSPNVGASCANGTGQCSADGRCIGCTVDTDCGTSTECTLYKCDNGACVTEHRPAGTLCRNFEDQCNGSGLCIDCVTSGGCGECCVCSVEGICIQA